jgi:formate hydrogenlyase subunit 4
MMLVIVFVQPLLLAFCLLFLPFLSVGLIRKTRAFIQGRVGAPLLQPFKDMSKLLQKGQTISDTTTWVFQLSTALGLATMIFIACTVPWVSFKPTLSGDDLFFVLYMLAMLRFSQLLAAMDTGSPFTGSGAVRKAFLSILTEPAMFITFAALGLNAGTTNLGAIFDFGRGATFYDLPVWASAALVFFLCSLIDLSRMPVDDPATNNEETMVHEAMILENSGKNLALLQYSHFLKMVVLYGLSVQCMLHVFIYFVPLDFTLYGVMSILGILTLAITTGIIESLLVKMPLRYTPNFIAYALTMSLFATAGALIGGAYVHHGL